LHVLLGGVFLLVAPLQFSVWVRTRHVQFHRWSGRVLLRAVFGSLFLIAICRAFLAIRRHQVARHREWMIRVFAIAVSTVRVVAGVLDVALTPTGFRAPDLFVLSLWTGWVITLGVAELWIRYTRPCRKFPAVPESTA
jgi:hypothetical protein